MGISVKVFTEFLHFILDSDLPKFKSFVDAHHRASQWFEDIQYRWETNSLTNVRAGSKQNDIAAMRLLSLYTWEWSVGLRPPKAVYRDHRSKTKLRVGKRVKFKAGKSVTSWFADSKSTLKDGLDPARLSEAPDLKYRYRLEFLGPKPSQIIFTPDTLTIINKAIKLVTSISRDYSGQMRGRVTTLLSAMKGLSNEITRQDEGEVIIYSPTPVSVTVLAEILGQNDTIDESEEEDVGNDFAADTAMRLNELSKGHPPLEPSKMKPRANALVKVITDGGRSSMLVPVVLLFSVRTDEGRSWVVSSDFEGFRYDEQEEYDEPPMFYPSALLTPTGDEYQSVFNKLQQSFDEELLRARMKLSK